MFTFYVEVCQQISRLISNICTPDRTTSVHIQRHPFKAHSKYFTTEFKLPESPFDDIAGTSRQNPIIIKQVIKGDFHNFLNAVYPLDVSSTYLGKWTININIYSDRDNSVSLSLSKDERISVLHLSTLWRFLKYPGLSIKIPESDYELSCTEKVRVWEGFQYPLLEGLDGLVLSELIPKKMTLSSSAILRPARCSES